MDPPATDIVVVTHFFPSHGGGIEIVAERLVDEYLKAGQRVTWFASATDDPPAPRPGLVVQAVSASNLVEKATQLPYPIWSPAALPRLWRAIGEARAVHVHEHLYVGSMLAIVMARLRGKPVVLTQHMGALMLSGRVSTLLYEIGARALAVPMMRLCSRVAFVSANVFRFFGGARSADDRRTIVFNGLDSSIFNAGDARQRQRDRVALALPPDAPVILFAGRFVRKKGLSLLQALTSRMTDVTWIFAGSGPDDPASWDLPNVRSIGRLSQAELARAYRAADVLVLPSTGEGFPLVVQEALACGTAVLSTPEVASACPDAAPLLSSETPGSDCADVERWELRLRADLKREAATGSREWRSRRATELWSWESCGAAYLGLLGVDSGMPLHHARPVQQRHESKTLTDSKT